MEATRFGDWHYAVINNRKYIFTHCISYCSTSVALIFLLNNKKAGEEKHPLKISRPAFPEYYVMPYVFTLHVYFYLMLNTLRQLLLFLILKVKIIPFHFCCCLFLVWSCHWHAGTWFGWTKNKTVSPAVGMNLNHRISGILAVTFILQ